MKSLPYPKALLVVGITASLGLGLSACDDGTASDGLPVSSTQTMSDTAITAGVKTKLALESGLDGSDITVETRNGAVTLSGTARDTSARSTAESATRSFDGVTQVNNLISVSAMNRAEDARDESARNEGDAILVTSSDTGADGDMRNDARTSTTDDTGQTMSDTWITTKVKSALLADRDASGLDVSVETENGVVTLEGGLRSQVEVDLVKKLAGNVEGVRRINATALIVAGR